MALAEGSRGELVETSQVDRAAGWPQARYHTHRVSCGRGQTSEKRDAQMKRHESGRAFADRRADAKRFGIEAGNDVVEQPALTIEL